MLIYERWLRDLEAEAECDGRPVVSLCFAQSMDGCLTVERGQPTVLSGPEAHRLTHELRAWHDAILIGVGTIESDNPQLTVRLIAGEDPQPVILDTHLRTPPDSYLVAGHPCPVWIAASASADPHRRAALEAAGAVVLALPLNSDGRINLPALLHCLHERGTRRLMVEGGAAVITAFLEQGLVDLACITIAPLFLGGLHSVECGLPQPPRLTEVVYEPRGNDLLVWGTFRSNPVILEANRSGS